MLREFSQKSQENACAESVFDKVKGCRSATLRLQRRYFLVNFAKFVRTHFFGEHHRTTASDYSSMNSSEEGINKQSFKS